MRTCCFTGHRNITQLPKLIQQLQDTLENLMQQGVLDFYAGGALGWDTLCELTVLQLRKTYPQIKLHLVLPCCVGEQTLKWNADQQKVYHNILAETDSVEFTSQIYWNGCMRKRNARLVELADCCVCYYDVKKSASGTGQTVRMAQSKGIPIINLAGGNFKESTNCAFSVEKSSVYQYKCIQQEKSLLK